MRHREQAGSWERLRSRLWTHPKRRSRRCGVGRSAIPATFDFVAEYLPDCRANSTAYAFCYNHDKCDSYPKDFFESEHGILRYEVSAQSLEATARIRY